MDRIKIIFSPNLTGSNYQKENSSNSCIKNINGQHQKGQSSLKCFNNILHKSLKIQLSPHMQWPALASVPP